jgi:hypothetical protein
MTKPWPYPKEKLISCLHFGSSCPLSQAVGIVIEVTQSFHSLIELHFLAQLRWEWEFVREDHVLRAHCLNTTLHAPHYALPPPPTQHPCAWRGTSSLAHELSRFERSTWYCTACCRHVECVSNFTCPLSSSVSSSSENNYNDWIWGPRSCDYEDIAPCVDVEINRNYYYYYYYYYSSCWLAT